MNTKRSNPLLRTADKIVTLRPQAVPQGLHRCPVGSTRGAEEPAGMQILPQDGWTSLGLISLVFLITLTSIGVTGCSKKADNQKAADIQQPASPPAGAIKIEARQLEQNELYKTNVPEGQKDEKPYTPWPEAYKSPSKKSPGDEDDPSVPALM